MQVLVHIQQQYNDVVLGFQYNKIPFFHLNHHYNLVPNYYLLQFLIHHIHNFLLYIIVYQHITIIQLDIQKLHQQFKLELDQQILRKYLRIHLLLFFMLIWFFLMYNKLKDLDKKPNNQNNQESVISHLLFHKRLIYLLHQL